MNSTIILEVDARLANYGQVLLTYDEEKVYRNLEKLSPLQECILKEKQGRKESIMLLARVCDYIVFYEEEEDFAKRTLYFLPFYTPYSVRSEILMEPRIIKFFDRLATEIKTDFSLNCEVEFVTAYGRVIRLRSCQLN